MEDQPTSNTNSQGFLSEPRASFIELSPPNTSLGPTPPETEEGVPPYSDPSQEHSRRHRYELGSDARISSDINEEPPKVIWGTNIVITEIISALRLFFTSFFLENDIKGPKYLNVISEMPDREDYTMDLDCADLQAFAPTIPIFAQLVLFPQEVIPLMDFVANGVLQGISPSGSEQDLIQVRPFNLTSSVNLRELNPEDIDKYIRVKGLVIRASNLIPDMRVAYFVCRKCGDVAKVENLKGRINEPTRCQRQSCMAQNAYELCHNRCIFGDKQLIKIQETPDSVPEGQTPHSVTLCVYDSLMDFVRPGDRIEVCGIYRASPIRASQYQRRLKSVFRTYVDVVHIRKSHQGIVKSVRSLDDKVAAEGVFSENADVYQSLSNSIAPNIWKLENVKKALLLQLFGGISKVLSGSTSNRFRGDINILLAGDPGVSKSQLLGYVHNLAPRGVYTSGKGSSAVGLTAYIVRDPETNQLVLESGALVLSDGGICCIDEFDKMNDQTRAILHEVMEQQTVSIAKAGIITSLNARASILAAANPIDSKYNTQKSIVENINLPPTILSRFDIICLLLDQIDEESDRSLARHISEMYLKASSQQEKRIIHVEELKAYIRYARSLTPRMTDEAISDLITSYLSMRRINGSSGKTIGATTRQLESLIRLSEAHAKVRLSEQVELQDTREAFRLVKDSLHSYAIDPLTGKIDMDMINTGKSNSWREQIQELKRQLRLFLDKADRNLYDLQALMNAFRTHSSIV